MTKSLVMGLLVMVCLVMLGGGNAFCGGTPPKEKKGEPRKFKFEDLTSWGLSKFLVGRNRGHPGYNGYGGLDWALAFSPFAPMIETLPKPHGAPVLRQFFSKESAEAIAHYLHLHGGARWQDERTAQVRALKSSLRPNKAAGPSKLELSRMGRDRARKYLDSWTKSYSPTGGYRRGFTKPLPLSGRKK